MNMSLFQVFFNLSVPVPLVDFAGIWRYKWIRYPEEQNKEILISFQIEYNHDAYDYRNRLMFYIQIQDNHVYLHSNQGNV